MLACAPGKAETERHLSDNCNENDIGIGNDEDRDTVISKRRGQVMSNSDDGMAMRRPWRPEHTEHPKNAVA